MYVHEVYPVLLYIEPSSLPSLTGRHYKSGDFEDAVDYYTMALHYCPEDDECVKDRAVYFANRAQGHLRLKEVSWTQTPRSHKAAIYRPIFHRETSLNTLYLTGFVPGFDQAPSEPGHHRRPPQPSLLVLYVRCMHVPAPFLSFCVAVQQGGGGLHGRTGA